MKHSLHAKDVADGSGSKRQRAILDQRLQTDRFQVRRRLEGKILRRAIQDANFGDVDFETVLGTRLSPHISLDLDHVFHFEPVVLERL